MAFRFSDKTYDCGLQTKIEGAINNHDLREAFELIGSFRKGQTPAEKVQWAQTLIEAYRGLAEVYIGVEDGLQRQLDGELTKYKELGECVEVVERLERLAEYKELGECVEVVERLGRLAEYKELGECVEVVERLERLAEYEKLVERLK